MPGPGRRGRKTAAPTSIPTPARFSRDQGKRRSDAKKAWSFWPETDSDGQRLDGRCEYRIVDPIPAARYWTLGLASRDGYVLQNPTGRYAYASSDILRRDTGAFEIFVAQEARPGNWLSPGDARDFIVVMRLYDTPFDIESRLDPAAFPKITKTHCA